MSHSNYFEISTDSLAEGQPFVHLNRKGRKISPTFPRGVTTSLFFPCFSKSLPFWNFGLFLACPPSPLKLSKDLFFGSPEQTLFSHRESENLAGTPPSGGLMNPPQLLEGTTPGVSQSVFHWTLVLQKNSLREKHFMLSQI